MGEQKLKDEQFGSRLIDRFYWCGKSLLQLWSLSSECGAFFGMWCYTLRLVGWVKCVGKENWTWWQLISRRKNPQNDQFVFKMAQVFSFLSIGFVYVSTITFVMEVNTYNKKWPKTYNLPGNPWGGHLYWKGYKEQSDQRHKGQLGKLVSSFLHFTIFTKDFQAEATGCYTIGGQVNLSKSRLLQHVLVSF